MTPEQFMLVYQASSTVYSVLRDAAINADVSKNQLATKSLDEIKIEHERNADNYLRLLDKINTNDAVVAAALVEANVDLGDLAALKAAFQAYKDAPKTTNGEIESAANTLKASIPAVKNLWGE